MLTDGTVDCKHQCGGYRLVAHIAHLVLFSIIGQHTYLKHPKTNIALEVVGVFKQSESTYNNTKDSWVCRSHTYELL